MESLYINHIAQQMSVAPWRVEQCVALIAEGATTPFISRYRKERTGGLDEAQVAEIRNLTFKFEEMDKRKNSILETIASQEKLTPELETAIRTCLDPAVLEDLYLPFRPKRRTKASIAKEKGLEPLAVKVFACKTADPLREARGYLNESVAEPEDALAGSRDIIAEWVSETAAVRDMLRRSYSRYGTLTAKPAQGADLESEEVAKYRNYFRFSEDVSRAASHRILAVLRGAREGILNVKIEVDVERLTGKIYNMVMRGKPAPSRSVAEQIQEAVSDSFKRLLHPSVENEVLRQLKEKADIESIRVFGDNLRQLLMAPPLGRKRVMAIDPGFRTGCKVVCLDEYGTLLHNDTIYPHPPKNERTMAMKKISGMVQMYKVEVIAVGNGTAGRETEAFLKKIALPEGIRVYSVSEDGASVYSASAVAREEFPDYDVTVRGAVSIGRRIMDPLAELVKIDPKSIGVGQYQHDVDQNLLKERLDEVVEACVNSVGVNLNTASRHLLAYISGLGPSLARNIVEYRDAHGPFTSRTQLHEVKRLGDKAFEQCAGFLRIPEGTNPLDNTAVHPESYALVGKMAADARVEVSELIARKDLRDKIDLKAYVSGDVGLPTLTDIMQELDKPGRDPRSSYKVLEFAEDIRTIEDLTVGMELPGIITNVTDFGAFVDFGIKQNGLIHVSKLSSRRVARPSDVVKVHQHVRVKVLDVDLQRGRIALGLVEK